MTQPRSQLVDPTQAGSFHCVNRCVRHSWLCGLDKYLGKSYEHRKSWVEARIFELGNIFACGVHAWAVMSNHLHIVVHMSPATANGWLPHAGFACIPLETLNFVRKKWPRFWKIRS